MGGHGRTARGRPAGLWGSGALRALALLGIVGALCASAAPPARAQVEVDAPSEESLWAASVRLICEEALPVIEKVSGAAIDRPLKVKLVADGQRTRELDADWQDGVLYAKKTGKRRGYRGHAVVTAIARAAAAKVVDAPWLRETLAYLYAYHALAELPHIYHHRTFLLEVLGDAKTAKGVGLGEWRPATVDTATLTADPEIALVFAYLYGADRTLGEDVIRAASTKLAQAGGGSLDAFLAAVDEAAGKPVPEYFVGWAFAPPVPEEGAEPAPDAPKPAFTVESFYDPDGDVLLNFEEAQAGTDPKNPDSDGDTLLDGEEVHDLKTDPMGKDKVKVPMDGNLKKWLRLKKFKVSDNKGDHKGGAAGSDLLSASICADDKFIYMLIEADSMDNNAVTYNVSFDEDGDGTPEYIVSFRADRQRWMVDTRGQRDLTWAEMKNHRLMHLKIQEGHAELRIPISAMRMGPKFTLLVYTQARAGGKLQYADACPKEKVDLDRWRQ